MSDEPDTVRLKRRNNVDWLDEFLLYDYNQATNTRTLHNLSGTKIKMELIGESSAHPILVLSTTAGTIIVPSAGGEMLVQVPAAAMFNLLPGIYDADCLLFGPDGSVTLAFVLQLEVIQGDTPPTPP
jgi:hypothetical protein